VAKLIHKLALLLVIFNLVGCNFMKTKHLDSPFKVVLSELEADLEQRGTSQDKKRLERAQRIEAIKKAIVHKLNDRPELTGQMSNDLNETHNFVQANQFQLEKWLKEVKSLQEEMISLVQELGKENFKMNKKGQLINSKEDIAKNQVLIYFTLQYLREFNKKQLQIILPLTLGSMKKEFDKDQAIVDFRTEVLDLHLTMVGAIQVADKDIETTLVSLKSLKKHGAINKRISKVIKKSLKSIKKKEHKHRKGLFHTTDILSEEEKENFEKLKADYNKKIAGMSFLFDPANPDSVISKILVTISNLTWGLVNSVIGAGVVLTAAIVSPFTRYVDFPTIKLSASGQQLYVDVSGLTPVAGKMSLGIFELDNHGGYYFASGHEGGHAKQSALLGPLYLPVVVFSYIIQGHSGSFMETWADNWAVD
tara:strand:- start:77317 stop:78579 length:1263 start_codon:yes stop_codon:yes gene_type:complete